MNWLNSVAGFGVGVMVGMTGVGGGALMTPLLVMLFGIAPATAVGTDLWFAAVTKMAGGAMHHDQGGVDWQVVRRLASGSLPAAMATLLWMHFSGVDQLKHGLILHALGWVLIVTALAMLMRKRLHAAGRTLRASAPNSFKRFQPVLTVVAGAVLGFLVTLTSVGAGALGTVMLLYLYPLRMTPGRLVGTDIVHAIPLTMLAGVGHLAMGNVDIALLGALLLGSIPGVLLGTTLSAKVPQELLRGVIATVLVVVASKMVLS